jgi:adenine-specific DNA-methyltransferase
MNEEKIIRFKDIINDVLKEDNRLWDEEKKVLNHTLLLDLVYNLDENIVELLLENNETRDKFFMKIGDSYVFKFHEFKFFLEHNKLDNSYTQYKDRMGLTEGKRYLRDSTDVVLNFHYKDCVLKGGQTTEEGLDIYYDYSEKNECYEEKTAKRKEIFFNEILAKDEIDRLLDEKALVNWRRYKSDGAHEINKIIRENGKLKENLIIKGNNLLASNSLLKNYQNKIKLVYLDPPYNAPGEANTFSYNNTFNHTAWLTFMKNRIEIAKKLISEDGIICISIDDNEYAYLKVLCDELLGRDNYLATVVVQIKREGRTDSGFFAASHDYAVFYSKNKNKVKLNKLPISDEEVRKWKKEDDVSRFYWRDFIRTGSNSAPNNRPTHAYVIYYSNSEKKIVGVGGYKDRQSTDSYNSKDIYIIDDDGDIQILPKEDFFKNYNNIVEYYPLGSKGERQVWRWSDREKILWAAELGEIDLVDNKIKIKDRIRKGSKPTTTWYDKEFNATSHGTLLLKKIFNGKKVFSYPKSLYTMIDIIQIATNPDSNDIILDMFGGSATTIQAVNRVNQYDEGNRLSIIVEQLDYIEKVTIPRIIKSLNKDSSISFVYFELAKWNEQAKEEILECDSLDELISLFDTLYEKYFLNYNLKIKEFKEKIIYEENFKNLTLDEQKRMFLTMLDLNQMYVPRSEMADAKYGISEEDQKLTTEFYDGG